MNRNVDDDIRQVFGEYMRNYPAKVRLQHYVHDAEQQQRTETRVDELQWISELLIYAGEARRAIDSQDMDHFAQAFERVIWRALALKISDFETAIKERNDEYEESLKDKIKEREAEIKEQEVEIEKLKTHRPKASEGGDAKAAKSPKRAAKIEVYKRWKAYHTKKKVTYKSQIDGFEVKYKNKADFARQNQKMESDLESAPVIERWCRDWCKGKNIPKEN